MKKFSKILDIVRRRHFGVEIRLKIADPNYSEQMESVEDFVERYFNRFYQDMGIFGDYYSMQEHGNRTKFIEFCDKKIDDLSRFYMVIKSLLFYKNVKLLNRIRLNYEGLHRNIHGMANYLSVVYQGMKRNFSPESDINWALQALYSNSINTERLYTTEPINGGTTEEIERYIRIYLCKENIDKIHITTEIIDGKLFLRHQWFNFILKLHGPMHNPYWKLLSVETKANNHQINTLLYRVFSNLKYTMVQKILEFVEFYDQRSKANRIYKCLNDVKGNLQNFTGNYNGMQIHGRFNDRKQFELFKVVNGRKLLIVDLE